MVGLEWVGQRWLLMALVVVGVGSLSALLTLWSQSTELRTTRIEDRLSHIDSSLAEVRQAVEKRVREDMMREYDRRFSSIEAKIVRIEERLLDQAEDDYQRMAPYQQRWEPPDHP